MPTRQVKAILQADIGSKGTRQFPTSRVEAFSVESSLDTDSDAFSLDIGNPYNDVNFLLARDTEVRVSIFTAVGSGRVQSLGQGLADIVQRDSSDGILSIAGRDFSAVAVDSQAPPGEFKHVKPQKFIQLRAQKLGFPSTNIAPVSELTKVYTDGSESEWQLWYRIAREKKMWLWCEPTGMLMMDRLHYSYAPTYKFGQTPRNDKSPYIPIESLTFMSTKQGRLEETWVFGERGDVPFKAVSKDKTISSWKRKNLRVQQSVKANSYAAALLEAQEEIFESIVGAQEITITIADPGFIVRQNNMCHLNVPSMGIGGAWFIVGVSIHGSDTAGYTQTIRLREKGYAISKRLPDEPSIVSDTALSDEQVIGSTVGKNLTTSGVRWGSAFAAAAREFGVANGWDFATFMGALLAICQHESGFKNLRNGGSTEWYPQPAGYGGVAGPPAPDNSMGPPAPGTESDSPFDTWKKLFANNPGNPLIPVSTSQDSGARRNGMAVGPMQLLTMAYKQWADTYGDKSGEYDGGRWQPEANIRASGRVLLSKLSGVDPTKISNVWIGVANYYGSSSPAKNLAYAQEIERIYRTQFEPTVTSAVESASSLPRGTQTRVTFPSGDVYEAPADTPDILKKAINFCLKRLGDPYKWGGAGPLYDCSSLVATALVYGGARNVTGADGTHHGDDTTALLKKGRLVQKDQILPGDLVFFHGGEHVGMYLGKGLFIHDPHTGDVVKLSSMNTGSYQSGYYQARRYVEWPANAGTRGGE